MEQVLLVVQVIITIALIAMVLLQRSESDGFGLGSGSGANLLSGRGSANLMTRTTAILAGLFILNSLVLSVMAAHNKPASIIEAIKAQEAEGTDKTAAPGVQDSKPAVPTEGKAGAAESKPAADKPVAEKPLVKKVKKPAVPAEEEAPADQE